MLHAVQNVILEDLLLDAAQCGTNGRYLCCDIDAVAVHVHHLGQAAYLAFDQAQTFLAGSLDAFTYFLYTPTGYWLQVARGRRRPVQTTKVEAVVPGDVRRKILAEIETTQRAQSVLRRPQARPSPRENHSRILPGCFRFDEFRIDGAHQRRRGRSASGHSCRLWHVRAVSRLGGNLGKAFNCCSCFE